MKSISTYMELAKAADHYDKDTSRILNYIVEDKKRHSQMLIMLSQGLSLLSR